MKNRILLIAALLFSLGSSAQTQVNLHVHHRLDGANFAFNQMASTDQPQDFQLTRMEYFLSKITIIHDGGMETALPTTSLFLINANNIFNENLGNFNVTSVEGIKFSIGVDTPANHSDPVNYPLGHPLADPMPPAKRMNWAWPAGYRFAAIEGFIGTNTNNTFQIHSLDDQYYYEQTVMVNGTTGTNGISINLEAEIAAALNSIAIADGSNNGITEHGSSATNILLLQNFRDHVFSAGFPLSVKDTKSDIDFIIYPNPSNGMVNINLADNSVGATEILVMDITGKLILSHAITNTSVQQLELTTPGMYIMSLAKDGAQLGARELLVH